MRDPLSARPCNCGVPFSPPDKSDPTGHLTRAEALGKGQKRAKEESDQKLDSAGKKMRSAYEGDSLHTLRSAGGPTAR